MSEVFNLDNTESSDDSESIGEPLIIRRSGGAKKDLKDTPVDNADDVPIFQDADKRGIRTASYLRIYKLDAPNNGFKGNVPLSSTLETISQLYGDGLYNIECCNARHQVLRIKENVRISTGGVVDSVRKPSTSEAAPGVITALMENQRREIENLKAALTSNSDEAKRQSKEYVELVRVTTKESAERDRAFMSGMNKNQQDFFANLMIAQSQMFQQTMALITTGHQQSMEAMRISLEREFSSSSSQVEVLLKGLNLGRELQTGDDEPDWLKALGKGEGMMTKLLEMKKSDDNSNRRLPSTVSTNNPNQTKNPLSREELIEVIRLKQVLSRKGIDLTSLVRDARETYLAPENENNETGELITPPSGEDKKPE